MVGRVLKTPLSAALVATFLLAGLLAGSAGAGEHGTVYTGCRKLDGVIIKVWADFEPPRVCQPWQTVVTWNQTGPPGLPGPQGEQGPQGLQGLPGEQGPPGIVPVATASSGGGLADNNVQPNAVVRCIIAIDGVFPSVVGGSNEGKLLGEIKWVPYNFTPSGWASCDGQLLSIASNSALFSLLGTIYGGDGRTTFALPDARGRSLMHTGTGPGLSSRALGSEPGTESEALTLNEMTSHSHDISQP